MCNLRSSLAISFYFPSMVWSEEKMSGWIKYDGREIKEKFKKLIGIIWEIILHHMLFDKQKVERGMINTYCIKITLSSLLLHSSNILITAIFENYGVLDFHHS